MSALKNYRNMPVKLVHTPTGKQLNFGDEVTSFRGETTTISSMRPPHKESSVGFVNNFYASVYDCKYVEIDEE
jgi:hypothetical protein|tara:strand:- start:35 stop:253 length:219 start_codon:yes stop_codon:yes gene_type:complete